MKQLKILFRRRKTTAAIAIFLSSLGALHFNPCVVSVLANESHTSAGRAEPTKAQRAVYLRALKEGRDKATAGNHGGAIASFQEALAAVSDDPAALSELGLAALHQKDYKLAEEATRKAIARIGEPAFQEKARLRAASFYNLGLILEEQGDRPKAIEAYVASLKAHPNRTVREHLIDLDRKAAATVDPLAPVLMAGPFSAIEEFCAKVAKPACRSSRNFPGPSQFDCHKKPTTIAAKAADPYLAVHIYSTSCNDGDSIPSLNYHLAIRTQAGWWFAPERFSAPINPGHYHEQRTFPELAIKDLIPGGPAEVLVRSVSTGNSSNAGHYLASEWNDEGWVVVSIGPSGKPSATPALQRTMKLKESRRTVDDDRYKDSVSSINLKFNFQPDGLVELSGAIVEEGTGTLVKGTWPGKHVLLFP